jgi:hypothetical protein
MVAMNQNPAFIRCPPSDSLAPTPDGLKTVDRYKPQQRKRGITEMAQAAAPVFSSRWLHAHHLKKPTLANFPG